jgi:hypothetical protein
MSKVEVKSVVKKTVKKTVSFTMSMENVHEALQQWITANVPQARNIDLVFEWEICHPGASRYAELTGLKVSGKRETVTDE